MSHATTQKTRSLFDFGPLADEYDRWYDTPAGRDHDKRQQSLVRRFLPAPDPGDRLLDVGCGTGHWSRFFEEQGFTVIGVDISPAMVAAASSRHTPNCLFEVADACQLPFDDASFDVVAAMATLEFVPDVPTALAEMLRCIRGGGSLLVGTLNRLSLLNRHRVAKGKEPYASARMFSASELRAILTSYGRVRMRVTAEKYGHRRKGVWKSVGRRLLFRQNPMGAFIVAEVRK